MLSLLRWLEPPKSGQLLNHELPLELVSLCALLLLLLLLLLRAGSGVARRAGIAGREYDGAER